MIISDAWDSVINLPINRVSIVSSKMRENVVLRIKHRVYRHRLRETLGLSADGSQKAYRNDDVCAFFSRVPDDITWNPRRPLDHTNHIFIGACPACYHALSQTTA